MLRFNPKWWWDPVPEWVIDKLDEGRLLELARVHIEAQQAVLSAQLKAVKAAGEIIGRAQG